LGNHSFGGKKVMRIKSASGRKTVAKPQFSMTGIMKQEE
jgi:hypothetical protein